MIPVRSLALALCFLLAGPSGAAEEELPRYPELGRLFTTPELRARLDGIRYRHLTATPVIDAPKTAEAAPEPPKYPEWVTFKGLLRRPSGATVIWLDRFSTLEGGYTTPEGITIQTEVSPNNEVTLTLPAQTQNLFRLRPGQALNTQEGKVVEGFQAPPPPAPAAPKNEPAAAQAAPPPADGKAAAPAQTGQPAAAPAQTGQPAAAQAGSGKTPEKTEKKSP